MNQIIEDRILTDSEAKELVDWVKSLSDDECRSLLYFFCGYRPSLMRKFKAEAEDGTL